YVVFLSSNAKNFFIFLSSTRFSLYKLKKLRQTVCGSTKAFTKGTETAPQQRQDGHVRNFQRNPL
ncbi:hypothetical protein, partial [Acinetobacter baumannii]|uniref:hypothetical protein n=1 Tax=Acinetobacter baumannii TaxID=470 RepID=UPI001969EBAF